MITNSESLINLEDYYRLSYNDFIRDFPQLPKKLRGKKVKPVEATNKIGRNDKCPCGSGKKYKNCCL